MTTALVVRGEEALALQLHDKEKLALIRDSVAYGLDDDEFDFFIERCRSSGLNPFSKQIYAIVRGKNDNRKVTHQVGIDGFRLIASRTGEYSGQDAPLWCGREGIWTDVWLEDEPPMAAKVTVYRNGGAGFTAVAKYSEYVQKVDEWVNGKRTGNSVPNSMWEKMPANQLAKCAEAQALRKAFPEDMSGLYSHEEMGQAENPGTSQPPAIPAVLIALRDALAETPLEMKDVNAFFNTPKSRAEQLAAIDQWMKTAATGTPAALVSAVADWDAAGRPARTAPPAPVEDAQEALFEEMPE